MFPLIEYPEALDLDDQYDKALIGMVTSHVCRKTKGDMELIDRIG